jgi:hypothetical protein
VKISNAALDPIELSNFLRSARMLNVEDLELINICISSKFIPVQMTNLKSYRQLMRRSYYIQEFRNNRITFPFASDMGILDIARLGIKIEVQVFENLQLYGITKFIPLVTVDRSLGELYFGKLGRIRDEILRLRDHNFPLQRFSMFHQNIDCSGASGLDNLIHVELKEVGIVNGSREMLKQMTNLENIFLFAPPFEEIALSDLPGSLVSLFFTSQSSMLEVSEPNTLQFNHLRSIGLSVSHSSKLETLGNLSVVFPKLELCLLGVESLNVLTGFLELDTLKKLLVKGVTEYKRTPIPTNSVS